MKNLKEFKEKLKVGQLVNIHNHRIDTDRQTYITTVQSNSFALAQQDSNIYSWVEMPRAKNLILDGNSATITANDQAPLLTITIL